MKTSASIWVHPRFKCPGSFATLATFCATIAAAAPAPKVTRADFAAIFQRDPVESVTLSPDGRHLAYVIRDGRAESLHIVDIDNPGKRASIPVPGNRFLGWATDRILVYAPPREVRAINADGTADRKLVDDDDISAGTERRVPNIVRLVTSQPERLLVSGTGQPVIVISQGDYPAAAVGTPVGFYSVDIATGKVVHLFSKNHDGTGFSDRDGVIRFYRNAAQMLRVDIIPPMIKTWENVRQRYEYFSDGPFWYNFDDVIPAAAGAHLELAPGEFFGERTVPLAFDRDPSRLYFASNVGRDKFGIYELDLAEKKKTAFAVEDSVYDLATPEDAFAGTTLVFDRAGVLAGINPPGGKSRWLLPELTRIQARLEESFRGREVKLVEWTAEFDRVLFLASSAVDPGRYFIFNAKTGRSSEFLRRSGEIDPGKMGVSSRFEFDSPAGVHLTGILTQPRNPVINPPPLVVYCRDFPSSPAPSGFSPDAQALAAIGFVVVEVNHRGMLGFGQKHLNAVLDGLDRIPLDDVKSTIEWVASQQKIDRTRIAIVGEGLGGFVAIRALELFPEDFRCAVCINAPVNPGDWVFSSKADNVRGDEATERLASFLRLAPGIGSYSAASDAEKITKPVLIMQELLRGGVPERQGVTLRNAIRGNKGDVEYETLNIGFKNRDPAARAAAFVQIADFMRNSLYDFNVKIGPVRAVK